MSNPTHGESGHSGMSALVGRKEDDAPGTDDYLRPSSTDVYFRPDGSSLYKRPASVSGGFSAAVNGKMPVSAWISSQTQSAEDFIGSADGTLMLGASIVSDTDAGGQYAFEFDGDNDYIETLDFSLESTNLTYSAWVKPDLWGNYSVIVGKDGLFSFRRYSTFEQIEFVWVGSERFLIIRAPLPDTGSWLHTLVIVEDDVPVSIYLDGVAYSPTPIDSGASSPSIDSSVKIGGRDNGFNFDGRIDDVRIWGQVLNSTDISDLIAAQRGGDSS